MLMLSAVEMDEWPLGTRDKAMTTVFVTQFFYGVEVGPGHETPSQGPVTCGG